MTERILVNEEDVARIEEILDEEGIDYDWDGGDRLMCYSDDLEEIERLFNDEDIDYDIL